MVTTRKREYDHQQASHTRPAKKSKPEHDPKQASHTRPAKRRKLENDPKQASHTRPPKRRELEHDHEQASRTKTPTDWSVDELIGWIQRTEKNLLSEEECENLRKARISGKAFLKFNGDVRFMVDYWGISAGTAMTLADLPAKLAKEQGIGKQTEDVEMANTVYQWKEFYERAKALHDKGEKDIDTEISYPFPEGNDPKLDEACEAVSKALQDASKAMEVNDNVKVKQAVHNLQKAYNDAAKSKTVTIRYIDAEPPPRPYSPLGGDIGRTLLAQPWMMELMSQLRNKSFPNRLVIMGNPGIGKSVALVGYLLFYLITQGQRVILQWETTNGHLGYVFDDNGVREVFSRNALTYDDGKPCYLLVSADGVDVYPLNAFAFCDRIIVVTSPNLSSKGGLREWRKQVKASQFIASRPSCHEVVYLLSRIRKFDRSIIYWMYREWARDFRRCETDCEDAISHLSKGTLSGWYRKKQKRLTGLIEGMLLDGQGPNEVHQIRDTKTNMTIPSELVTMEKDDESTNEYIITFATSRISEVVIDVQEKRRWRNDWETLTILFRNPETRVTAGKRFQNMFLRKFRDKDPNTMPRCYKLRSKDGPHPESDSSDAVTMPWAGLRQQSTPKWISVGTDTDGSLYSKKELKKAIEAVNLQPDDPPAILFLIPCAQNWASWDAALFIGKHRENEVDIHIIFLQLTVDPNHDILTKGLNQVKDAIPRNLEGVRIHYQYVLVLLTRDEDMDLLKIPVWRPVLKSSKDRKPDNSWDSLEEYVMFVPMTELVRTSAED